MLDRDRLLLLFLLVVAMRDRNRLLLIFDFFNIMLNEQSSYLLLYCTVLYSLLQLSLWVMVFLILKK